MVIGLEGRVFTNGPGDLSSIPGRVIPKTQKWYLIPPCLTLGNIRYVSRVKWSNPEKGVVPSPIPRSCSYWKGNLLVAPDCGHQLISIQFSSIWSIDGTLSGATFPSQSGPGSNGNEGILCIPQSSSITEASPSDCLVSYPGHSFWGCLTSLQRSSLCILQPQPMEQFILGLILLGKVWTLLSLPQLLVK